MQRENRKTIAFLIFIIPLWSAFGGLFFGQVDAFKPNTHLMTGNSAIDLIINGSEAVIINGKSYAIDHRIAEAIRAYPDHYRGGVVGPDAFPDVYVGQAFIHPDTRCDNGFYTGSECRNRSGFSFTYEWLRHVYDSAWNYYDIRNGDEEAKKALAFTYGFMTHVAGDIWSHTLVNRFAEGIFPGPVEIINDSARLPHATRHVIVESYIGEHTPDTNLAIDSPHDFIYRTLIDSSFIDSNGQTSKSLGRGQIFNYFFDLRDRLMHKSIDLRHEAEVLQTRADACAPLDFSCSRIALLAEKLVVNQMFAYVNEWIKDIDSGLHAWPVLSQEVARNLFSNTQEDHVDKTLEVVDDFIGNHLLSMLGAPDKVGAAYNLIDDVDEFVSELLGETVQPLKNFRNSIILHTTGLNIPALKEFYSNPANYINRATPVSIGGQTINIGLPSDTSEKLDRFMGLSQAVHNSNLKFNPEAFAATKNTIMLAKLLLLSPETLNQLIIDHGGIAIYRGEDNGFGQSNVMLDFVRSMDANHQWRRHSIDPGDNNVEGSPRQHSEGMPLWLSCSTRDQVFRVLFVDWENLNFPDLGETCLQERSVTVTFLNATISEINNPRSNLTEVLPMIFSVDDELLRYPDSGIVKIVSGSPIQLPENLMMSTVASDEFTVASSFTVDSLTTHPIVPFSISSLPRPLPLQMIASHTYNETNNFGFGTHTDKIFDIGWDRNSRPHVISFELTYRID